MHLVDFVSRYCIDGSLAGAGGCGKALHKHAVFIRLDRAFVFSRLACFFRVPASCDYFDTMSTRHEDRNLPTKTADTDAENSSVSIVDEDELKLVILQEGDPRG